MLQNEMLDGHTLYRTISMRRDQLIEEIEILQRRISGYPEGELFCRRNGSHIKWYLRINGKSIYIPKQQKEFVHVMADKKFLTALLRDLQHDLEEIRQYLRKHQDNPQHARKLLTTQSAYTELLTQSVQTEDLSEWVKAPYETNPFHPEAKIHTAPGNIRVRSKAEAMIATFLYTNHIPFRYECALPLGTRTIYPDFTIRHPITGETYYWEHFGKMDDPVYRDRAYARMQLYSKHDIHPSIQLIITSEIPDCPLSTHTIECRIHEYFDVA